MTTGKMIASGSSTKPSAALSNQTVNLFSDLLVHHMGAGLADGITQGSAGPDAFRTAPLWGVGQRVFFLHDGRTRNLREAIDAHQSRGSEANRIIERFRRLRVEEQQDILNFLPPNKQFLQHPPERASSENAERAEKPLHCV